MTTGPKLSRGSLDVINNTFVHRNGLLFEYYPIVCEKTRRGNWIDIEVSPGIMAEGVAIIDRQMYDVSLHDLLRRRIDVRKKRNNDSRKKSKATSSAPKTETSPVRTNQDEPRLGEILGDEVSKAADMAWENQVGTLLETLHSEEGEEFEVTGTTQSRSIDENSPVPDIFEDIDEN